MASLRKLAKKKAKLEDKLGALGDKIDRVEGGYEEHLVADKYDKTRDKLDKVIDKINKKESEKNEIKRQAARYRWLRDNKHLDAWWSVEGPKDRCENIDADIDAAIEGSNNGNG